MRVTYALNKQPSDAALNASTSSARNEQGGYDAG